MRDFAKSFYLSPAWRRVREYIFKRDFRLCAKCGAAGEIVHHIIPLDENNIHDAEIALGADNLITLCRKCHGEAHGLPSIDAALEFDDEGNLERRTST